jgi:hypothetical protein
VPASAIRYLRLYLSLSLCYIEKLNRIPHRLCHKTAKPPGRGGQKLRLVPIIMIGGKPGKYPILETNQSTLFFPQAGIPPDFEPIVQKALARPREKSYQSVSKLLEELREVYKDSLVQNARSGKGTGICAWFSVMLRSGEKS